jgi:hypothetical protein
MVLTLFIIYKYLVEMKSICRQAYTNPQSYEMKFLIDDGQQFRQYQQNEQPPLSIEQ